MLIKKEQTTQLKIDKEHKWAHYGKENKKPTNTEVCIIIKVWLLSRKWKFTQ